MTDRPAGAVVATEIVAPEHGDIDTLAVRQRQLPQPGPGQVLVRVQAVGVNPTDWKTVHGSWPRSEPLLVGFEAAGVVTGVGPDSPVAVGDEVIAYPILGAYASHVLAPAGDVTAKPASIDFMQAANLLLAGTTAAEMLHVAAVSAGETIVVHGASGATGVSVLQQAARAGVRVVATGSERNFALVRSFGAHPVAYGAGLEARIRAATGNGIHASLDCVGTDEALDVSLRTTPGRGRVVTIANRARAGEPGVRFLDGRDPQSLAYRNARRGDLVEMAARGELTVPIARSLPLTLPGAQAAFEALQSEHPGGKLVLIP